MPPHDPRTPMTPAQMLAHLRAADAVAQEAAEHGHPPPAVLVGPDDRVLMRQGNLDTVRHAETELCRRAAAAYSPAFLWARRWSRPSSPALLLCSPSKTQIDFVPDASAVCPIAGSA